MGAGGGFDLRAIDPQFKTEILDGLVGEMESVFLQVFTPKDVNKLSGKVPFKPSKYSLRSAAGTESSKRAIDAAPERLDGGLSSADFSFDFKYSSESSIHKTTVDSVDFDSPEALLGHIQEINMVQIAGDVDADGATVLQSTTLNNTVAATAVWSDSTNARPITDLDTVMDEGGSAYDLLWLGEAEARELAALPAIVASSGPAYEATDARASQQFLVNYLLGRYGHLRNVIIGGNWYNGNQLALSVDVTREFDGTVWAGKTDHMIVVEFGSMRETDEGYDTKTQEYWALSHLYIDILRGEDIMGTALTGT